jgi:hypothetical protein
MLLETEEQIMVRIVRCSLACALALLLIGLWASTIGSALAESASVNCKRGSCSIVCNNSRAQSYCTAGIPRCQCLDLSKIKGGSVAFKCEKDSCSRSCDAKRRPRGLCTAGQSRCYCDG